MSDQSNNPMPVDPSDDERQRDELVAYLDGELDASEAEQIERRLAEDGQLRTQMQELERVWDSLDKLPHDPVDETFVKTTVKMVTVAAEDELKTRRAALPRQRALRRLAASGTMVACALAGFLIALALWTDKDDSLIADLPVVENLDLYLQADSLEFLTRLHQQDVAWNGEEDPLPITFFVEEEGDSEPARRRERVDNYSDSDKYELKNKHDRFTLLSIEGQQRLRDLHQSITEQPNAQELLETLAQYQRWLSSEVSAGSRADLASLEISERVLEIEKQVARLQQHRRPQWQQSLEVSLAELNREVSSEDQATIREWWREMRGRRNADGRTRPGNRGKRGDNLSTRKEWEKNARPGYGRRGGGYVPRPREEDVERLKSKLSPSAQEKLKEAGSLRKQAELLGTWSGLMMRVEMKQRMISRSGIPVDDEVLMAYFSSDKLSSAERQELMNYPKEEMRRRLWRIYAKRELGMDPPEMRRRDDRSPPPPRGDRGPRGPRTGEGPPGRRSHGPDAKGPDAKGPDAKGPDAKGPRGAGSDLQDRGIDHREERDIPEKARPGKSSPGNAFPGKDRPE